MSVGRKCVEITISQMLNVTLTGRAKVVGSSGQRD